MFGLICLLATIGVASSAEILMMPSSLFPVHRYNMKHLAGELIRRGHTVTWFEYGLVKVNLIFSNYYHVDKLLPLANRSTSKRHK
jgi:hypothetical protein